MSQIPSNVRDFLDSITVPGAFGAVSGFKVMAALRRKLFEMSGVNGYAELSQAELDEVATGCKPEVNAALSDEDIDFLANKFAVAFFELTKSFEQAGFHDPKTMATKMMQSFTLKF